MEKLYATHLNEAVEAYGGDTQVLYHRVCALKLYLVYLVVTSIFVDKSAYYIDVVYLIYFIDIEWIHEYK